MLSPEEKNKLLSEIKNLKESQKNLQISQNKKDNPFGFYAQSGFEFIVTLILGFFLGYWVDQKLSTSPLFLLLGFFLGFTLGLIRLLKLLQRP